MDEAVNYGRRGWGWRGVSGRDQLKALPAIFHPARVSAHAQYSP